MKRIIIFYISLTSLVFFSSCANKEVKKKVEIEIQSTPVENQKELEISTREYIFHSTTLSDLQKKQLLSMYDKTDSEMKNLSDEINKSKLVLIKTILQPSIDEREVGLLRMKIKKLSKKRMTLDLKSFDDARKIIDPLKEIRDREFLYNSFLMRDHPSFWY